MDTTFKEVKGEAKGTFTVKEQLVTYVYIKDQLQSALPNSTTPSLQTKVTSSYREKVLGRFGEMASPWAIVGIY